MAFVPMLLPPFLTTLRDDENQQPISAVYSHVNRVKGDAHVLCWLPKEVSTSQQGVLFFIPGNPGQADYYRAFLNEFHESHPNVLVVAQAHLGHTPDVTGDCTPLDSTSLVSQTESAFEMMDSLHECYPDAKLVLAGHSIGAWMCLKAMKAKPTVVNAVFLLTPTLSNMVTTPNGRALKWLFWPISAAVAGLFSPILGILPFPIFSLCLGSHWPKEQIAVLKSMLLHPKATVAALHMAHDEMDTVKILDVGTLQENKDRVYAYYATHDDWVGDEKRAVIEVLGRSERVREDSGDTPHSFCIAQKHASRVAIECSRWMDIVLKGADQAS